ncbi:MAG: YraN family protein [Candidatus Eisenbacteria bacterium]|nr:YraN family protein [Candidatus Eisenbacteria bacterium]
MQTGAEPLRVSSVLRGREGEAIAALFLEMNGYRIVGRNVRCGPLEIDLLARKAGILAVVEVRLRSSRSHGRPEESVRWRKRHLLRQAAACLPGRVPLEGARLRFDVIAIETEPFGLHLRHLQDWWRPCAR